MAQYQGNSAASVDAAGDDGVGNPGYLNNKFLMHLAKRISTDFYQFGVFLDLEADTINAKKASHSDVVECAFQILITWKQRSGRPDSMTTFNMLHQALTDLERTDLVDFVSCEAGQKTNPTPGATAKPADIEQYKILRKQLETEKKEKMAIMECKQKSEEQNKILRKELEMEKEERMACKQKSDEEIAEIKKRVKALELKENALTPERITFLIAAAQPVEGESDDDARHRRIRVLTLLRQYEDLALWRRVSALVLHDGELDVAGLLESTDVETLEWFLTSGVANELRQLYVGGGYRGHVHEIDTWREVTSVRRLCNGLKHLGQLTHLWLMCCHLTDAGFRVVTETLQSHCPALTRLGCSRNDITDESSAAVKTLLTNRTELTVFLSRCRLSPDVCQQLEGLFGDRIYVGIWSDSDEDDTLDSDEDSD